jgi:hypothetical protein
MLTVQRKDTSMSNTTHQKPKRKIRVFTWFILLVNLIFAAWLIFGIAGVAGGKCSPELSQSACDGAKALGGGIGALLIIFLWVAADVILGIIWLVTRKREPQVVYVNVPTSGPAV